MIGFTTPFDAIAALASSGYGLKLDAQHPISHPQSEYVYLESLDPQPAGFNRWIVHANWSSTPLGFHTNPGNPLNDPARYRWLIGNESEATDRAADGTPLFNSAMDAFSTNPTRNYTLLSLSITRNEPTFNPVNALTYINTVNSKAFTILNKYNVAAGWGFCRLIAPTTDSSTLSKYSEVEYIFDFKAPYSSLLDSKGLTDSWKWRILDQGLMGYYDAGGGVTAMGPIGRYEGTVFTQAPSDVRLDGTGKPIDSSFSVLGHTPIACPTKLPAGVVKETAPDGAAVFLHYPKYGTSDFMALNL
ncbi:MAG TPA: hypothetical protein VHQ47_08855 [Phycisphaerae bacterium]|nr:hypothetical protein [Phycisphaerae bacterium]HVV70155.1 hypothetical protein [Verrucomicrobiae bacterium]